MVEKMMDSRWILDFMKNIYMSSTSGYVCEKYGQGFGLRCFSMSRYLAHQPGLLLAKRRGVIMSALLDRQAKLLRRGLTAV